MSYWKVVTPENPAPNPSKSSSGRTPSPAGLLKGTAGGFVGAFWASLVLPTTEIVKSSSFPQPCRYRPSHHQPMVAWTQWPGLDINSSSWSILRRGNPCGVTNGWSDKKYQQEEISHEGYVVTVWYIVYKCWALVKCGILDSVEYEWL